MGRELMARYPEIYGSLGLALSNFSDVELKLLAVFKAASGWHYKRATDVFWSVGSTRNQLKTVDLMFSSESCGELILSMWLRAKPKISEAIALRDSLAHGKILTFTKGRNGEADIFYAPRANKASKPSEDEWATYPEERMYVEDLLQISEVFSSVAYGLSDLFVVIQKFGMNRTPPLIQKELDDYFKDSVITYDNGGTKVIRFAGPPKL